MFMSRNYRLIVAPQKFDVLKTEFTRGPMAGVIHAISPFWMKLCHIEGTTQLPLFMRRHHFLK